MDSSVLLLALRLKNFTGQRGQDVERFFQKFDCLSMALGWDEPRRCLMLPLFLDDKAYCGYEMLAEEERAGYDVVKTEMISQFRENRTKLGLWEELNKLKKKEAQTVTEFCGEVRNSARKVGGVSDEQIKSIFLLGLPAKLRCDVLSHGNLALKQTLEKARLYEAMLELGDTDTQNWQGKQKESINALDLREEIFKTRKELN